MFFFATIVEDDIFSYKKQLYNYKFPIHLTKNISKGPCSATKLDF